MSCTYASADICATDAFQNTQDLKMFGCNIEQMASDCQEWFKKNPETIKYAKDCKAPINIDAASKDSWEACKEAFGESWLGIWNSLATSIKKDNEFYDACENEPELKCKRQLADESYFQYKSDAELRDTLTGDLIKKRENVRAMAARDPKYRKALLEKGVPLGELREGFQDIPSGLVWAAAREKMRQLGVKAQCYNDAGYSRMACYAIATIVDPTLIAGGAALGIVKGGRWVKAVFNVEKKAVKSEILAISAPEKSKAQQIKARKNRIEAKILPDSLDPSDLDSLSRSQMSYSDLKPLEGRATSKTETVLQDAKIINMEYLGGGVNETYKVTLEDGTRGVWKPHNETPFSNYRAEVLAYELDQKLGFKLVPETVERTIGGTKGSVQLFKQSRRDLKATKAALDKQEVFDYLICNPDRRAGNFLVAPNGDLISIDHGLAFRRKNVDKVSLESTRPSVERFLRTDEGRRIIEKIRAAAKDSRFEQQIKDYIGSEDAAVLKERMRQLLEVFEDLKRDTPLVDIMAHPH